MNLMMPPKPAMRPPATTGTMKALVYQGPGKKALEDRPKPEITAPTDAIVKVTKTTICGTDLHILKGDVPTCQPGRILGHEGVGIVEQVGPAVTAFKAGRPCPDLLRQRLRQMRILPEADVLALHDRRLDPRQHHRRHAGRVRPHSLCGHQPLSHSRRRRRGGAGDAQRHPADRLRVRRAQRQGRAGEYRGDRRRRPDRARRAAHRAVLLAGRDHHDRSRRQSPRSRQALRRHGDHQQHRRQGAWRRS